MEYVGLWPSDGLGQFRQNSDQNSTQNSAKVVWVGGGGGGGVVNLVFTYLINNQPIGCSRLPILDF